jgi:hypothetical protein
MDERLDQRSEGVLVAMAVEVEVCALCAEEIAEDAKVVIQAKESATAPRVIAHLACNWKATVKRAAGEA